ncbi:MAG: hypothetical protein DWI22_10515 [Planctomycetota bacterium]|nr:MAG: hypothetical protein DWI22_10515 [Planctomycetota bacterium]
MKSATGAGQHIRFLRLYAVFCIRLLFVSQTADMIPESFQMTNAGQRAKLTRRYRRFFQES